MDCEEVTATDPRSLAASTPISEERISELSCSGPC